MNKKGLLCKIGRLGLIAIILTLFLGIILICFYYSEKQRVEEHKVQVQEILNSKHQRIFTTFVDYTNNDGILPFKMWQQNITIKQGI